MYSKLSRTKFHTASIYKINLKRLNLNVDDQNTSFCWCCLWNPLNVITLGQRGTDNIYWMITITSYFQAVMYWNLVNGTFEVLSSKQLITLSVITLSIFHWKILSYFCFCFVMFLFFSGWKLRDLRQQHNEDSSLPQIPSWNWLDEVWHYSERIK